jgi:uncharacterized protein
MIDKRSPNTLPALPREEETATIESVLPPLPSGEKPPAPPSDSPRRSRRAERDGPRRRLSSAGHALAVCVLALVISLFLNAPGIHKSAYNKPDSWQRDVTIALTGPLADVSHALLLDRPRAGVQALIGRSGVDEIDTELGIPVEDPPTRPTTPTPAKVAFTPNRKLRLWVAGDSLVITPGYAVMRAAGGSRVMKPIGVDGRVATGLTRPDVYNWFTAIRDQLREERPNVVVLGFGANDDKAYMTGLPENVTMGEFGGSTWRREYRRRVGALFDLINRSGAHAVWIGLPQTESREQTIRFDVVNAAVVAEANERSDTVTFIDTYTTFAGDDGGYAQYLPNGSGGLEKVRAGDGVHFERAGGDIIARAILKSLNRTFDLTSWQRQARESS